MIPPAVSARPRRRRDARGARFVLLGALVALLSTPASALATAPGADPLEPSSSKLPRPVRAARSSRLRRLAPRPSAPIAACSSTRPICVHVEPGVSRRAADHALTIAEGAFVTLDALGLRRPRFDGTLGGDGRFDLYVSPRVDDATALLDVGGTDPFTDGSSAFVVVPPSVGGACDADQSLARAVAEASLLGLDGAADRATSSMSASYLATLISPCGVAEMEAVDTFQRAPDRCLAGASPSSVAAEEAVTGLPEPYAALHTAEPGAFLFPKFLDERFGGRAPGTIAFSLFAVAAHRSRGDGPFWVDDPGFFDALRSTLKYSRTSFGQAMLDFAVDRAFMGTRDDGAHLDDVARYGDLGRVRFEWSVKYASLPRRLAPARPLDALGSTYVWLDLDGAPTKGEITFVADWEVPFLFRWALVKIDKSGGEAGRIDVAPVFGEFHAEKTVRDLDGLAGLLVVGVNDGEWSKAEPFAPGEPRLDPKSYMMTLYH